MQLGLRAPAKALSSGDAQGRKAPKDASCTLGSTLSSPTVASTTHVVAAQHVAALRDLEGSASVLPDEQDSGVLGDRLVELDHHLLDGDGREAEQGLVEEEDLRPAHLGTTDDHHLLLTARERAVQLLGALSEDGEEVEHVVDVRLHGPVPSSVVGAELQVLHDTQPREHLPHLGDQRQLKNAPGSVRLEAFVANARGAGATELLERVREAPDLLVLDPTKEIRRFRVEMSQPMGLKRGRGRGAFIDSVLDLLDAFYSDVVQGLKAWSATPPKLREERVEPEPDGLTSTALSSQDGPEGPDPAARPAGAP